jgi:hypothetical protein
MTMYKLDDNIPIPPKQNKGSRPWKYPLRTMAIGQSFFVPDKKTANIGGCLKNVKDRKFVMRSVDGGVRVWRIA